MAVTDSFPDSSVNACRAVRALTSAALLLPGLATNSVQAQFQDGTEDSVSIQYNRYQEGDRDLITLDSNLDPLAIEVFRANTNLYLNGRTRFSLDYTQDTWSGATPVSIAPLASNPNRPILRNSPSGVVTVGASPYANTQLLLDQNRNPLHDTPNVGLTLDPRNVLVMSSASPESRDQIESQLTYEWNSASASISSGYSVERDFESYYGSVGGSLDLNRQNTSLSFNAGFSHNEIAAILDPDFTPYLTTHEYSERIERIKDSDVLKEQSRTISLQLGLTQVINQGAVLDLGFGFSDSQGYLENPYKATSVVFIDPEATPESSTSPIVGDLRTLMEKRPEEREQYALSARFVQYVQPFDAALHLSWEHSTDNWGIDTQALTLEWVQPLASNWTVTPRVRYYSQDSADFFHPYLVSEQAYRKIETDETGRQIWFDANNPDFRYFLTTSGDYVDSGGIAVDIAVLDLLPSIQTFNPELLPGNFSSDHRLSAFGSLSGGLTLRRFWNNGVTLEASIEHYDRASGLKLNGDGGSGYADFHFWMANAALTVDISPAGRSPMASGGMSSAGTMRHEHNQHRLPAGVMFAHRLDEAGQLMLGYNFAFSRRSDDLLHGSDPVADDIIVDQACPGTDGCRFVPTYMNMKMHMLHVMYAPTDWMTLTVMPQFMDMDMNLRDLAGRPPPVLETHEHSGIGGHTTGGLSDAVVTGLFRLYESSTHQLHAGLGVSIPLGAVDEELRRTFRNDGGLIHFGMQLGSGTWDLLPSLTYSGMEGRYNWGAQISGSERFGQLNDSGYRLGDALRLTAWAGFSVGESAALTVRYAVADIDDISGDFSDYNARIGPMDFARNQGGRFHDIGVGFNYQLSGRHMGNSLSVEWLQPVHDRVNGFQRQRDGSLAAQWHFSF